MGNHAQSWADKADLMTLAAELEDAGYRCSIAAGSHTSLVLSVQRDFSTAAQVGPFLCADWLYRRRDWYTYLERFVGALSAAARKEGR